MSVNSILAIEYRKFLYQCNPRAYTMYISKERQKLFLKNNVAFCCNFLCFGDMIAYLVS